MIYNEHQRETRKASWRKEKVSHRNADASSKPAQGPPTSKLAQPHPNAPDFRAGGLKDLAQHHKVCRLWRFTVHGSRFHVLKEGKLPDLNTAEAVALDVVGNGLVSARSAEGSTRGSQSQLYNTKKHTCKANWGGFEPSYMSTCLINRENVDHAPAIPLFPPSFASTSCDFRHLALPEHHSLLLFRPPQRTGV